jgi:hypothetical protein
VFYSNKAISKKEHYIPIKNNSYNKLQVIIICRWKALPLKGLKFLKEVK